MSRSTSRSAPNVLMIHPAFQGASFWNYRDACEATGAKYPAAPLGLITVAAMLPDTWTIRLVDKNVKELLSEDLDWADLVMIGSMLPQQPDACDIIEQCNQRNVPLAIGGPDVTSTPHRYEGADFVIMGEAEGVIDGFIADWENGATSGHYEGPKFQVDVTKTPIPRYDLLNFQDYFYIGMQFSRGCPFTCEFCDIIELFGRVPRAKEFDQMFAELQHLYDLGYRGHVDFVDDNLIGNKKAVKQFLPLLIEWQKERGYPFEFSTEASLNMADDPALMEMMAAARFFVVFIGIESPDEDVLKATQKKQNASRDIVESVHRIYQSGIMVIAGFIVGFDSEKGSVERPMKDLIDQAAIPISMAGLLYALPGTQLTRRLEAEGRMYDEETRDEEADHHADQCTAGLNFETIRPRREIFTDYRNVIEDIYEPKAYFKRVLRVTQLLKPAKIFVRPSWYRISTDLRRFVRIAWAMTVTNPAYAFDFWKTLLIILVTNPLTIKASMSAVVLYMHLGPFSRYVIGEIDNKIAELDDPKRVVPRLMPASITQGDHGPSTMKPSRVKA